MSGMYEIQAGTGFVGSVGAQNPIAAILAQQICAGINCDAPLLNVANATDVAMQSVGTVERGGREI